jgi:hypothetical protein
VNRSFSGGQGRNRTVERSVFQAELCSTPLYFAMGIFVGVEDVDNALQ